MKLTYIFHSGFALETEQSILVFDYWLDPSSVIPSVLQSPKPLYVLSSHFHEDHFNKVYLNLFLKALGEVPTNRWAYCVK